MANFIETGTLPGPKTDFKPLPAGADPNVMPNLPAAHWNQHRQALLDLRDHTSGWVNVRSYGAKGDGVTDDTAAIQAAIDVALAESKGLYLASGTYLVSATLNAASGLLIRGEGERTVLRPAISDGSPVLNFPAGANYWTLADFTIKSTIDSAAFYAGEIGAQNCTGIRAQSGGGLYAARFNLRNVRVFGVKTAYDITGFIITADNVWATYSEIGFKGDLLNSSDLNLRLENNRKDFQIINSLSVNLRQLIAEGSPAFAVPSTIDASWGVILTAPYFEGDQSRTRPGFLAIGAGGPAAECRQVEIVGATISGAYLAVGAAPIALDRVNGASVDAYFIEGAQRRTVSTTSNTKNFRLNGSTAQGGWLHDSSKQIGPALNYWPNRTFDLWLRGWANVAAVNAAASQETAIVRRGANAMRITGSPGTDHNHFVFQIAGNTVTALRGKTVRMGAWVWVPDLAAYDESNRTHLASVYVDSYNGTTQVSSPVATARFVKGEWNFATAEVAVQSDATRIDVRIYANNSTTLSTGAEYVVVDSITLTEASTPFARQLNDDLADSPLVPAIGLNGRMVAFGTAAPTDADQTYEAGDLVLNVNPIAGGIQGWRCVSSGSPGTWEVIQRAAYVLPSYSASVTLDAAAGNVFVIGPTDGSNFTINAPSNPATGQRILIRIRNAFGALGTATWNSVFKMGGAWVQPANGFSRSIEFVYSGSVWFEVSRTSADVPN